MYLKTTAVLIVLSFGAGSCLDLDNFYKYLQDHSSSSNPECAQQKAAFLQGLINKDAWASRMLDAYGRIPKGMAQGNSVDPGMFDQCLNIAVELDDVAIKGRYCYAGLMLPLIDINLNTSQVDQVIEKRIERLNHPRDTLTAEGPQISVQDFLLLAACIPDACDASDLFGQFGVDLACQTKGEEKKLDAADIASICFFSIIAWLIIVSTSYDYYLRKTSKEPIHAVTLAFSLYTNGEKILKTNQDSSQILFFNGMKVLSMFCVIMGHRYSSLDALVSNKEETTEWKRKWYAIYVLTAPLAVDTFLFISGALLAYTFLKSMRKPNQKFNIVLYYLHRYLRLTPAFAVLYIFQITLARRIFDGPLYPILMERTYETCTNSNWWSLFLYIQNYVATDNMCLAHTWYLSVDMQVYIISPLLLLPMHHYGKRITYTVLPILTLLTITYTILIFYFYEIRLDSVDYQNLFYYVTHTRTPPWFIGLIFGTFLLDYQQHNEKYKIKSKLMVLAIWGLTLCMIGFLFFYQDDAYYNHTRIKTSFFFTLQKPLWTVCLCWISYACISGNAEILNSFLSISAFQILSKITYSTYLVHLVLQMMHLGYMRTTPYFTDLDAIRIVIADIFISYLVGAVWTLAFESPIIVFEKIIFKREGKKGLNKPRTEGISNAE